MAHLNYDDLAQRAVDGGFTVDLDGRTADHGYAVGSRPDRTLTVDLRAATLHDVADYIYSYVVDNGYELRNGYLLGAWTDDGKLYLDLVSVHPDQSSAMKLARSLGEIAVYNLATRETIHTDTPPTWDRERALDETQDEINHPQREDNWNGDDAYAEAWQAQHDDGPNPYHGDYSEE